MIPSPHQLGSLSGERLHSQNLPLRKDSPTLSDIVTLATSGNSVDRSEIDKRLPYRIGHPTLPVLPVDTRRLITHQELGRYAPNTGSWIPQVVEIADDLRVDLVHLFIAYRFPRGDDAKEHHVTIVLLANFKSNCESSWIEAVQATRALLVKLNITCVVELIDYAANEGLKTYPFPSENRTTIEAWMKTLPTFLAQIKAHDWVVVDVFMRDVPASAPKPTVIIGARDANEDTWWTATLPTLHTLLRENSLEMMDIVLLCLRSLTTTAVIDPRDPDPSIIEDFYGDTFYMGTSCGVLGSDHSGTLGGRVKLNVEGKNLVLGITNHHVIQDAFSGEERGNCFPPRVMPYSTVVSPSAKDHSTALSAITKSLEIEEKAQIALSLKIEASSPDDARLPLLRITEQRRAEKIQYLQTEHRMATTMDRTVGPIYATSGERTCNNTRFSPSGEQDDWALDWALILNNSQKDIGTTLQRLGMSARYLNAQHTATQYSSIDPYTNYKVIKRGRTTGWSTGTISAVPSVHRTSRRPPEITPTHEKKKMTGRFGDKCVFSHTIAGDNDDMFKPGDSGALVLLDEQSNTSGAVIVGIRFAGNDATCASYMVPMDLVVSDIEAVTGGKVIEPVHVNIL